MARYGEKIDMNYDPIKDDIYPLFVNYFENPKMRKLKDVNQYSMYIAKIHSLLVIEFRYLIIFVNKDEFKIGHEEYLSNLQWISLQTRTLTDDHDLPFHNYTPKRLKNLDQKIHLKNIDNEHYIYLVENLPLQITLLPKKQGLGYNKSGSIINALETYQTLINFV